jgi:hypothetical protein
MKPASYKGLRVSSRSKSYLQPPSARRACPRFLLFVIMCLAIRALPCFNQIVFGQFTRVGIAD